MTSRCWLAIASRCGALAALSCAAWLGSCRQPTAGAGNAGSGADTHGEPAASRPWVASAPFDAGGLIAATRRACRVMALRGTATTKTRFSGLFSKSDGAVERGATDAQAPRSLAQGDLLPETGIIELGTDAELTVQATVSTREITVVGPATAEACPGGDEAVRLARGRVTAFPGAGVRPGAEVWIATPLGVVRFSDAQIDMAVQGSDADRLKVAVIAGQASVIPAAGVVAAAPPVERADAAGGVIALSPGATFEASRPAGAVSRWVRDLVAACLRRAGAAREAAKFVASTREGPRTSIGDLAFAHVRARQHARAACESAWAAGTLAPGLLDAALRADLEGADATWKGAPVPPPHPSSAASSRAAPDAE